MKTLKAHVTGGRLVVDEPTELPEGTEVELIPVSGDELDDEDRARLHDAIAESEREFAAGAVMDEQTFWRRLRAVR